MLKARLLFNTFKERFPDLGEAAQSFIPIDTRTIKIRINARTFLIFTYKNDENWGLQTYKNYMDQTTYVRKD